MAGLADYRSNGPDVIRTMNDRTPPALEAVGLQAEGYAKLLCPVDTGRLRNSISHAVQGDTVYIGTNVEYGPYVEYGTRNQRPQPYLTPAATQHTEEYKRIIQYYMNH